MSLLGNGETYRCMLSDFHYHHQGNPLTDMPTDQTNLEKPSMKIQNTQFDLLYSIAEVENLETFLRTFGK